MTAKIYQFPIGGRAALGGRRYGETKSPIDLETPPVNETVCSDSWQNDEVIEESNPTWER